MLELHDGQYGGKIGAAISMRILHETPKPGKGMTTHELNRQFKFYGGPVQSPSGSIIFIFLVDEYLPKYHCSTEEWLKGIYEW